MAELAAINEETKEAFAASNKEAKRTFAGIKADQAAKNKETKEARAVIKADQAAKNKETKEARAIKADLAAESTASMAQPAAPQTGRVKAGAGRIVCPHCQVRGRVHTKQVKVKRGISGGKATGAVMTLGWSVLATGLSRKENATQATCKNCHSTWMF
jgi:hypothetical protein